MQVCVKIVVMDDFTIDESSEEFQNMWMDTVHRILCNDPVMPI